MKARAGDPIMSVHSGKEQGHRYVYPCLPAAAASWPYLHHQCHFPFPRLPSPPGHSDKAVLPSGPAEARSHAALRGPLDERDGPVRAGDVPRFIDDADFAGGMIDHMIDEVPMVEVDGSFFDPAAVKNVLHLAHPVLPSPSCPCRWLTNAQCLQSTVSDLCWTPSLCGGRGAPPHVGHDHVHAGAGVA